MLLAPYTVLDFTDERGEIGPMLLGDMGADVGGGGGTRDVGG